MLKSCAHDFGHLAYQLCYSSCYYFETFLAVLLQDGRNFPDNTFLGDFLAMLKLAQAHAISIIPTLWSFEAMRPNQSGDTQFSGSHEGLFELSENADAFVKNALTPLLDG